ncbi:hypothetical protein ST47_g2357 [Ascochyta rabiei]|uniref:Uncharacterized protein n=2 Tax=Didymella rabiei TaxID=5454 RepID=A0A163JNQ2_DIDRA|nr:hypothetical protein ST47_g2357 [Ascochyta rabiei]
MSGDTKVRTMPKRVRTPNCTHVDMDRIYGRGQQCHVCGREPSIGFLYECRQDRRAPSLHNLLATQGYDNNVQPKSPLRLELEDIGLSESIICTAEQGNYTAAQLAILRTQKTEMKQTIADSIQGNQINDAVARLAAFVNAPSNNDGTMNSKIKDVSAPCNFRACHTCRPYYRDRVYISFTAVALADFPPMSKKDVRYLSTKPAHVIRAIGASHNASATQVSHVEPPVIAQTTITFATSTNAPHTASTTASDSSDLTFKTTQTDVDELCALRRPRRRFYNMGHRSSGDIARDLSRMPPLFTRQGLRAALQDIFRPGRDSSSSGSMITLPVPRTGTVRDPSPAQPVGEFDMGALRRVRRQKERNELRNGTYVGGFENVGATATAMAEQDTALVPHSSDGSCSSGSDCSVYSCISQGSEVEVEGGVALTEEAVGSHTPDILAVDIPASKSAICIRTKAMAYNDDDLEVDFGLQSIMTQA